MGVGAEADGDAELRGKVDDAGAGVDFPAILAEAGGIELDGKAAALDSVQETGEQGRAVLPGDKGKLLAEVGVADDVKEAGLGGQGQAFEVGGPNLHRLTLLPLGDLGGVVNGPGLGDVMDGADEVIPGVTVGEVPNPVFAAGQVIHLEAKLDDKVGMVVAGMLDTGDILVEFGGPHAPIVEVVLRHRGVVGEADLLQAEADGLRRQFGRLASRVTTERRVHVIIGR